MSFVHKQKREYEIRADPLDLDEDLKLPPIVMLWDQWGFHNSRFMAYEPQFRWLRYVHGQKVVCPPHSISRTYLLEVLDFNIHTKRLPEEIVTGNTRFTIHTESSLVPKSEIFMENVMTRLPYTRTVRNDMGDFYSGFMIDEERLVGLRSKSSPEGEMGDIDVFTL